ncbi:MAG: YraN family protein [bacterium]|nr:YraN family protein [bacterium]
MTLERKTIGAWGEEIAANYLRSRKYRIVAQNYRQPWGEIDLIAEHEGVVVFCEVKTNSRDLGGGFAPELRVNSKKSRHILRTAKIFFNKYYKGQAKEWRVDIISVILNRILDQATVRHFKNVLIDTN